MDWQLLFLCSLTFIIHLIGTLAYSARIAGVRTGKIALSFTLFNILVLLSRTSNGFQAPVLAKRIESQLGTPASAHLLTDLRWLLFTAAFANLLGMLLIPTFQRLFSRAVVSYNADRSMPRLFSRTLSASGRHQVRQNFKLPAWGNLSQLTSARAISPGLLLANMLSVALWTVAVFAALYAGFLHPHLRNTAGQLSTVINGTATFLMFLLIDPSLSVMTDDVAGGKTSQAHFRKSVVWLAASRFAGTLLAQLLLLPAAILIAFVAKYI
jgi:Alternate to MurJ